MDGDSPRIGRRYRLALAGGIIAVCLGAWWWLAGPGHHLRLDGQLLAAAREGGSGRVGLLLRLGADPNTRSSDGRPALMLAGDAPVQPGPYVTRMIGGHAVCRQENLPCG